MGGNPAAVVRVLSLLALASAMGCGRGKPPAEPIVETQTQRLCGVDGCCVPTSGRPCTLTDGCGGTRDCDGICEANGGTAGSLACTTTLSYPGHLNCTVDGTVLGCKPDPAYPQGEQCNGKDDDGDGVIDNNVVLSTCLINGVCGGTQSCSGGVLSCIPSGGTTNAPACTSVDGYAGHYNCDSSGRFLGCQPDLVVDRVENCDGKDNDGDGIIDNAPGSTVPSSLTAPCNYPRSNPTCPKPTNRCVNGAWTGCDYSYTVICPSLCNGVQMTAQCSANNGTLGPCLGPPEICNGEDDNCDGQIDEGSVCAQQPTCQ